MDGKGVFYRAEVSLATNKRCIYDVKEVMPQQPAWRGHSHLAIAPTKMMDRIEWMAEKATEVGFDEISFLNCSSLTTGFQALWLCLTAEPVSYTHLDVYKRQGKDRMVLLISMRLLRQSSLAS